MSVVVATFDWSEALRVSLPTALGQTVREIEVIVVGDGCTDDSEHVVRSLGDSRLRWLGLPENSGDQAVPNNAGIAAARAPWIAYLGHDDLWHRSHLERLLAAAEHERADVAHAGAILYGPPGSGIRWLAGITPSERPEADAFLPPSTLLHRRDLTERIGPWGDASALRVPIDVDLQRRAWDAGARFTTSGSITAFKFPAGWRRDAYRERPVGEQQALAERLAREPDAVERELVEVCRAFVAGRGERTVVPSPAAPGAYARRNRSYKGLDAPVETSTMPDEAVFDPATPQAGFEWHEPELDERGRPFRWSGPLPRSFLVFRVRTDVALALTIRILASVSADVLAGLSVEVSGVPLEAALEADPDGGWLLTARVPTPSARAGEPGRVRVALCVPRTVAPARLDPATPDDRELGVAVAWARLAPARAAGLSRPASAAAAPA